MNTDCTIHSDSWIKTSAFGSSQAVL